MDYTLFEKIRDHEDRLNAIEGFLSELFEKSENKEQGESINDETMDFENKGRT